MPEPTIHRVAGLPPVIETQETRLLEGTAYLGYFVRFSTGWPAYRRRQFAADQFAAWSDMFLALLNNAELAYHASSYGMDTDKADEIAGQWLALWRSEQKGQES